MRIVTCTLGTVLAALVGACGAERAQEPVPEATLRSATAAAEEPAVSTEGARPDETGPTPVGTLVDAIVVEPVATEPAPDSVVDTDGCAERWNGAANAATRAGLGADRRGAWIRTGPGEPRCRVTVSFAAVGQSTAVAEFWEQSRGVFSQVAYGDGITAPPERVVDREGRIGRAVAPLAPAAAVAGDSAIQAGFGSFCWETGEGMLCADSPPPGCGDGYTPLVLADAGGTLAFDLPFMPAEPPVVTRWGTSATAPPTWTLERRANPTWTLPNGVGEYPISLFARAPGGGDVSYTACVRAEQADVHAALPVPPAVLFSVESGGTVRASVGSYCWRGTGCVDRPALSCSDGQTPHLPAVPGDRLVFMVGNPVEPAELVVLADATQPGLRIELPGAGVGTWDVDLPSGPHAVAVHTYVADGEATYGVCLEVGEAPAPSPPPASEPASAPAPAADDPLATIPVELARNVEAGGDPPRDERDCVERWNADANVEARVRALGGAPTGAIVRTTWFGAPVCTVYVLHRGPPSQLGLAHVQTADGTFGLAGAGTGLRGPAEWWQRQDGTLRPPLRRPPPAEASASGQTVSAGYGSYCWPGAGCVDAEVPYCGDGRTPWLPVPASAELTVVLPAEPAAAPTLTLAPGGEQTPLPRARRLSWTVDLEAGAHTVLLYASFAGGGDVTYAVCVDVTP